MLKRLFNELMGAARRGRRASKAQTRRTAALDEVKALIEAHRLEEAERALAGLLESEAPVSEVHFLRGEVARKRGELDSAIAAYRQALSVDSGFADAWFGMGLCSFRNNDALHAHLYMRTAHALRPRDADILNELGLVEHSLGNLSIAQGTFEQAANANPEHPEAWNNLGLIYAGRGRVHQAKRCFLRAVSIRPAFYTALCNLALACQQLEQLDEAERHLRAAIAARAELHEAWLTLGTVLQDQGSLEEARSACAEAVRLSKGNPDARTALAGVLYRLGDLQGAEREYRGALAAEAAHAEAALGLGQLLIAHARFAEGWDLYEARLRARGSPARHFPYPSCEGPVNGRNVLVYGEQGAGDEILFASCLPELARDAGSTHYVCNPRLEGLFRRSFPGLSLVSEAEAMRPAAADKPRFDCSMPIGSLPRLYRRSAERYARHQGYLAADPARVARWRERLAGLHATRALGVAWRGGRASTGRALRWLQPEDLAPLLNVEGCTWICLQADATPEELARISQASGTPLAHWPEAHGDLDETAALMCALDGSVAVTSTVVHLGGALGRPVWVLTPFATTWRYMSEGSELPWYPSVKLFRQGQGEPWNDVVARVVTALRG